MKSRLLNSPSISTASGCNIEAYLKRNYPYTDVLTHALGYVARINVKDLQQLEKDGKPNNLRGPRMILANKALKNITKTNCMARQAIRKSRSIIKAGVTDTEISASRRRTRSLPRY